MAILVSRVEPVEQFKAEGLMRNIFFNKELMPITNFLCFILVANVLGRAELLVKYIFVARKQYRFRFCGISSGVI